MNTARLIEIIQRHRLVYAIVGAIGIGLLLVTISMSLYISSGASRLDLSRPGYEKARTQVVETKEDESFSTNGPMNVKVVDEFQQLFAEERKQLRANDAFDSADLDDAQLHLGE